MNEYQAGLIALGVSMIFGPKIGSMIGGLFKPAAPAGAFDRSRAVATLLEMEDEMEAAGLSKAAALTGSLLVELVSPGKSPPAAPAEKKAGR